MCLPSQRSPQEELIPGGFRDAPGVAKMASVRRFRGVLPRKVEVNLEGLVLIQEDGPAEDRAANAAFAHSPGGISSL